jgi:putative copper export protein
MLTGKSDRIEKDNKIISLLNIINDFAHDLFTGLWISSFLVIFILNKKVSVAVTSEAFDSLFSVMKTFFWLGIISLLLIIATGIIRLCHYGKSERTELKAIKRQALIVKHIILAFLFLLGTYFSYRFVYP